MYKFYKIINIQLDPVSKEVFEKLFLNIRNSIIASSSQIASNDSVGTLRKTLVRALYFIIRFGNASVITSDTVNTMNILRKHAAYDKQGGILCLQELYHRLFSTKMEVYKDIFSKERKYPIIKDLNVLGLESILFHKELFIDEDNLYESETPTTLFLVPTILGKVRYVFHFWNLYIFREETKKEAFDIMEPIIYGEMKSYPFYHSNEIKNALLYMLSRIFCIAVSFHLFSYHI